jgi:mRNA interferase MazF
MTYIPKRGDIAWINFNPQAGHEQAGHRPALILSPKTYNQKVGLVILCPVTTHIKNYPFEVVVPDNLPVKGVILADQVKSLDWRVRQATFMCKLPDHIVVEVLAKLGTLLQ